MTGPNAARPGPLPLREFDELAGRTGDISLTVEDVVLLVLRADPRPVEGLGRLAEEVLLALRGPLRGPDVEPAVFERGPGGRVYSREVECALDRLDFSNCVKATGDAQDAGAMRFEIAPRGRTRIKEKWDALSPGARRELAQKRPEWDAAPPVALKEPVYVHNEELLRGWQRAEKEPSPQGGADAAKLQGYVDRGDRLCEEKRYDEAHAAYETASRSGAPDADLELKMARCLSELELYEGALDHCRAAIAADPELAAGHAAAAHCLHKLGLHAEALQHSGRAVQQDPSNPRAHSMHGIVLNRLGRHAEALPHHQRAAGLDPRSATAHQNASFSLFHLERYAEALLHAERAAEIAPGDPLAHERISTCLSRLGRREEAIPPARRAIEAAPGRVDSYIPLIALLQGLGRHEEVLGLCGRAVAANPPDPRPHYLMALSLRELGRLEEALPPCLQAAGLDSSNTDFRTLASYLLRDLGRFAEALPHCEAVVSARPDDPRALSNLGGMLAELGRHEEALPHIDRAIRIEPRQPVLHYNRAMSLREMGRPEEALEEYRRAAELDPGNTGAHNNAGIALAELGRDAEAVACFDRAIGLDPGNFGLHCNKALSLQSLGLHRQALEHFDRAAELSPGSADAYVGRLSCLSELGLPDEAIGHYARDALGPAAAEAGDDPGGAGRHAAAAEAGAAEHAARRQSAAVPEGARDKERERLVESLLSRDESEVLEFKSWPGSRRDRPSKPDKMEENIAKELCGLLNTRGGDLLIGVGDDDGKVEGLAPGGGRLGRKQRGEMLEWVANVIVDYLGASRSRYLDYAIVGVRGLDILHCAVAASTDEPVILRKRVGGKHEFFARVGNTCRPHGLEAALGHIDAKWPDWSPRRLPTGRSASEQEGEMPRGAKDGGANFSAGGPCVPAPSGGPLRGTADPRAMRGARRASAGAGMRRAPPPRSPHGRPSPRDAPERPALRDGELANAALRIYLDVNHWITLSKIRSGQETDPDLRAVYGQLDGLSKSGRIVVPFSVFTMIEASRYRKREGYRDLVDVLVGLSRGHVLKPSSYFLGKEVENAMSVLVGEKPRHDIRSEIIGRGPADMMDFSLSGLMERMPPHVHRHLQGVLGWSAADAAEGFEAMRSDECVLKECLLNEKILSGVREAYRDAEEVISKAEAERWKSSGVGRDELERRLIMGDFNGSMAGPMKKWAEERGVVPSRITDLLTPAKVAALRRLMPAHHTRFILAWARDIKAGRPFKPNDLLDIAHLAAAIPYTDVVVTDKMAAHLATSEKLDRMYGCTVLDDLKKLAHVPALSRTP